MAPFRSLLDVPLGMEPSGTENEGGTGHDKLIVCGGSCADQPWDEETRPRTGGKVPVWRFESWPLKAPFGESTSGNVP